MSREAGFTLVEMLVVLAVIGVATGAVALGIGAATRRPGVESAAHRLAGAVQAAADRAETGDRALALAWDAAGYSIVPLDGGPPPAGAERTALPSGTRLSVAGAASPVPLGADGDGRPFVATLAGAADRWRIGYDGLRVTATRARTE